MIIRIIIRKIFRTLKGIWEKWGRTHETLRSLLGQAKTDVDTFLRKEKWEEISDENLGQRLADIERYINGIAHNFVVIKEGIEALADS